MTEKRQVQLTATRYTDGYFFRQEMATCKKGLPGKWKEGEVSVNVNGDCVFIRLTPKKGDAITYAFGAAELLRGAIEMEDQ